MSNKGKDNCLEEVKDEQAVSPITSAPCGSPFG